MIRKILPLLFFISIDCYSQQYIANDGEITFFSFAPIEDIKAVNKKVSAAFDISNNDIVFQLYISDFISSEFNVKLEDYNVSIPTIVMYKIAEEILVNVEIKLNSKR